MCCIYLALMLRWSKSFKEYVTLQRSVFKKMGENRVVKNGFKKIVFTVLRKVTIKWETSTVSRGRGEGVAGGGRASRNGISLVQ